MSWAGSLRLHYRRDLLRGTARTVVHDRHDGPLRVLASLWPEDPAICHSVLVHPPGGLVGGDALEIAVELDAGAHALITSPGATRFYRSTGATASQHITAVLAPQARLEWLPLETIAYSGCLGENAMHFELAPGAEMIGWELLALGLPASGQPFERGRFGQSLEIPDQWLERGVTDATDKLLLDSPLGWAGRRVLGTLWFATGTDLPDARRDTLLDAAREVTAADAALNASAGSTSPSNRVVVLRVLAPRVEPAMALLTRVRAAWRQVAWQLPANAPRIWRT